MIGAEGGGERKREKGEIGSTRRQSSRPLSHRTGTPILVLRVFSTNSFLWFAFALIDCNKEELREREGEKRKY